MIKIKLEIFADLQALFPPLKIDIFCCIVPPIFHKEYEICPSRNSLCRENRIRGARAARTAGYAE